MDSSNPNASRLLGGPSVDLLQRLMSAATLRQKITANNVANQNTPGFQRENVVFEDLVRESLARGRKDLAALEPEIVKDELTPARADGNNVNIELEMNTRRETELLYDAWASILQHQFQMVQNSIELSR
jgi:flagellar basal-body rod protein FlgB